MIPYFFELATGFTLFAVCFTFLLNKLLLNYHKMFGVTPKIEEHRFKKDKQPTLGGMALYLVFLFAIITYTLVFPERLLRMEIIGLLLASSGGFLLGLADDAYGTNPFLKFLGQFFCANLLIAANLVISITPYETVNYVFTMCWIIGLMNSINMLDNMDGIVAGVTISISITTILLLVLSNESSGFLLLVALGLFGGSTGFLYFNFPAARMYMGDSGSQFLGALLAGISILVYWPPKTSLQLIETRQFVLPLLIFIVPLIDTITVILRRVGNGQSPFIGGKDHTTHHLMYLGLSERAVFFLLSGVSLFSGLLGVLCFLYFDQWNIWRSMLVFTYFLFIFILMHIMYDKGKQNIA